MLFFGPAPHSSLKCETAWEYKITCKLRVVHVGCLKLRVESTYTVALFLQCAHSLGHNVPNPCCCAGPLVAITQEKIYHIVSNLHAMLQIAWKYTSRFPHKRAWSSLLRLFSIKCQPTCFIFWDFPPSNSVTSRQSLEPCATIGHVLASFGLSP